MSIHSKEEIEISKLKESYAKFSGRKIFFIIVVISLIGTLSMIAMILGVAPLTLREIFSCFGAKILGIYSSEFNQVIIWELRLPRILMAIIAGCGFAISGTVMQGIMRNPLVSPFTIGISAASGFGASLAIILGIGPIGEGRYLVIANAFLFALVAFFLVYGIARLRGASPEVLILAGIAVMYLFSAMTSLLQYGASKHELSQVVYWLFGSLTQAKWENLFTVSLVLFFCLPILLKHSWDLNALTAGDEVAMSLGVNTNRVRILLMTVSTLITATIICFTGIIGFVCLVAPHITRMIIGNDHRFLLPCSSLVGAFLLLGSDTLGRVIIQPTEIPVGIITSFIGVPMFLYLLITRRRRYWQ